MKTFIQLRHYLQKPTTEIGTKTPCQECKEEQDALNKRLGLNQDNCEDLCSEELDGVAGIEADLGNYYEQDYCLDLDEVRSFCESPEGRLIIVHGDDLFGQIFANKYADFVERVRPHLNLI